jgi:tetratricopeptide (TPR) repeat protein
VVHRWIEAVRAHRPGEVDGPLVDMAAASPDTFGVVARALRATLEREFREPALRNHVRYRGALLHTDIALLLPEHAARLTQQFDDAAPFPLLGARQPRARPATGSVVLSIDGQYVVSDLESGHWSFASWILRGVTPHPSSDQFVRLWYRAVAATFLGQYRLGNARFHLERARAVLPRDPILLFYEGALHEALASPRFQSVPATTPGMGRELNLLSEDDELRAAERLLREALGQGAPPEARLRLGRVLGRLGKHGEAVTLLEPSLPPEADARLSYFRELFLGTEQGALGRADAACASLERAARLFPTAQAPLVAMSDVLRRSGDRKAALDALRRLQALPADPTGRTEPWWDYHRSYAEDARDQLAAVRAWVDSPQEAR